MKYKVYSSRYEPKAEAVINPSLEERWAFRQAVDEIDIWKWESHYEIPEIIDGTGWSLVLEYHDAFNRSIWSNAYPGDYLKKRLSRNIQSKPLHAFEGASENRCLWFL